MAPPLVVAATWIHRRGDAVLGVRPHGVDVLFLPGGLPEPGETLAEAAAREAREEVGVHVDPDGLVELARIEDDAHGRPGSRVLLVCFAGPGVGEPVAQPDEIAEVVWVAPQSWGRFAAPVQRALALLADPATPSRATSP